MKALLAMNDGRTPLYVAAHNGHKFEVQALLASDANVNQAMNDGRTPLYIASRNGHKEVVLPQVPMSTKPGTKLPHHFTSLLRIDTKK